MGKPIKATEFLSVKSEAVKRAEEELRPNLLLANNVFRLRVAAGYSQAELASRAGMKQPRIADIEGAHGNPGLDTLNRLAEALNTDIASLFQDGVQNRQIVLVHHFAAGVVDRGAWRGRAQRRGVALGGASRTLTSFHDE